MLSGGGALPPVPGTNTLTALLCAHDLGLVRGERRLFRAISFALNAGELLHVEGTNGSGKTSLLRVIAGLVDAETGSVSWQGQPIRDIAQTYRGELVWLGHKVGCKLDLTLLENLRFEHALRRSSAQPLGEVLERLRLSLLTPLPMRALSAGQQRRVALARLLLSGARLWLLDEPFTNLDRDGRTLVRELIAEHLRGGGLCVAASHQPLDTGGPEQRLALA